MQGGPGTLPSAPLTVTIQGILLLSQGLLASLEAGGTVSQTLAGGRPSRVIHPLTAGGGVLPEGGDSYITAGSRVLPLAVDELKCEPEHFSDGHGLPLVVGVAAGGEAN